MILAVAEERQIFMNPKSAVQYTMTRIMHSYVVVPTTLFSSRLLMSSTYSDSCAIVLTANTQILVMNSSLRSPKAMIPTGKLRNPTVHRGYPRATYLEIHKTIHDGVLGRLNGNVEFRFQDACRLKLFSYSYLEAGMIESLGTRVVVVILCINGFSPSDLRRAQQGVPFDRDVIGNHFPWNAPSRGLPTMRTMSMRNK
ncbi:p-type cation-transporting atpase [Moniliophthora roreri]|nr:p-type cation-transporting atpase [Moniliophthora roreri]